MNKRFTPPAPAASLDIDVLRSVVEIAETSSMTVAADRVGRTPAALSMQLKKLEETLGRALFTRSRQGMSATSEGERLLSYARKMVDLNAAALDAFRGPALSGEVSVGMTDDLGHEQLARVLAAFAKSHPGVTVAVRLGSTSMLAPEFDRGGLDLTLLTPGGGVERRETDQTILREDLAWIGAEGGIARSERPLPIALADHGCAWRQQALAALAAADLPYRIAYISDFDAAEQAAISADLAIGALPRSRLGPGFVDVGPALGLPSPGTSEVVLRMKGAPSPVETALASHLVDSYRDRIRAAG